MGAARKYPDELRDRAVRLVLDLVKDQDASVTAACRKVGGELGIKADTLRGWAKQAQVDRGMRPGSTSAWSPGIFVDISIMLLLVPNCQIGARNPLGLPCRADVVSGRDCNIARCSRTRRS